MSDYHDRYLRRQKRNLVFLFFYYREKLRLRRGRSNR